MLGRCIKRLFSYLPSQSGRDQGRLTVVLDLDETICHTFTPNDTTGYQYKPDIQEDACFDFEALRTQLYIYKRPHFDKFLEYLDQNFEPILYASGIKPYVNKVAEVIDPKGIFRYVLHQDHCAYERAWSYPQYEFLKDLSLLRDDTSRMVMIEDDWQGMYKQPDNYLNIEKYEAWYEDDALKHEIPSFLNEMKDLPDVRPFIRARFMMKYLWAENQQFFQLTKEDEQMADFMTKYNYQHYDKIKQKYEELYKIKNKYIPSEKLW